MLRVLLAATSACAAFAGQAGAYVYWTNAGVGNASDGTTLGRSNLDASGVAHGFLAGLKTPAWMAIDAGHIYWANLATNSIGRANLNGSGVNPKFIPNAADPTMGGGVTPGGVATDGTYIYTVNDRGIMFCLDAKTGREIYGRQRLPSSTYSGSPVLADGKIYITNEDGLTSVIKAGPVFEILARNDFGDYTLSSPAVSEGQIFFRTAKFLYAIGKRTSGIG